MKYFDPLKELAIQGGSEGFSDLELRLLLLSHRVLHKYDFPTSVKEYLKIFGKKRGNIGNRALGECNDFIEFKLATIYELVNLKLPFLEKSCFVFYNEKNSVFSYVNLSSTEEDPYVSLFIVSDQGGNIIINYCKFAEFIIKNYESSNIFY